MSFLLKSVIVTLTQQHQTQTLVRTPDCLLLVRYITTFEI